MDYKFALAIGLPIGVGLAALGVGMALGRAVGGAMEALGRQPEAMGKIMTVMLLGCALIETIIFYVLAFIVFPLVGKI
ncbi:MAG: ATP synthase F0 subunit C [Candidatus Omnitrophica bacterium]|nr:ATP synthase F0 subunit C [Candidatus Omnitrophota bacterium]